MEFSECLWMFAVPVFPGVYLNASMYVLAVCRCICQGVCVWYVCFFAVLCLSVCTYIPLDSRCVQWKLTWPNLCAFTFLFCTF